MMRTLIVPIVLLAACGGGSSSANQPETPNNQASPAAPAPAVPRSIRVVPGAAGGVPACGSSGDSVHGVLIEHDGQVLAGATIVAAQNGISQAAISDENGCYSIRDLAPGRVDVTIYYGEWTGTQSATVPAGGPVRVDAAMVGAPPDDRGEVIIIAPGP
jgi:hypothetical protein